MMGPQSGNAIRAGEVNVERFWSKVARADNDDCWPWLGAVTKLGYGSLILSGSRRTVQAHRAAYALAHGELPAEKVVRHSCDNTRCCNPLHLMLGSQRDNIADMVRRGRGHWQKPRSRVAVGRADQS